MDTGAPPGLLRRVVRWSFGVSGYVLILIGKISPRAKDLVSRFFSPIHIAIYRRSGGRRAFEPGAPSLLLTVPGRKSGKPRTTPLFYLPDGERCVLCASYGGDDRDPQWYRNLMAAGEASVRIGDRDRVMTVAEASPEERERLWPRLVANWPSYEMYQRQTDRRLPVVTLTPI
jgi:deazaflavin-dependent oxidoreductase (nitroreductase family)